MWNRRDKVDLLTDLSKEGTESLWSYHVFRRDSAVRGEKFGGRLRGEYIFDGRMDST